MSPVSIKKVQSSPSSSTYVSYASLMSHMLYIRIPNLQLRFHLLRRALATGSGASSSSSAAAAVATPAAANEDENNHDDDGVVGMMVVNQPLSSPLPSPPPISFPDAVRLHAARTRLVGVLLASSRLATRVQKHTNTMVQLKRLLGDEYDPRRVNLVATHKELMEFTRFRTAAIAAMREIRQIRRDEGFHTPRAGDGGTVTQQYAILFKDGADDAVAFLEAYVNNTTGLCSLFTGILAYNIREFHATARTCPRALLSCVYIHEMHDKIIAKRRQQLLRHQPPPPPPPQQKQQLRRLSDGEEEEAAPFSFRLPPIDLSLFDGELGSEILVRQLRQAVQQRAWRTLGRARQAMFAEKDDDDDDDDESSILKRELAAASVVIDEAVENAKLLSDLFPPHALVEDIIYDEYMSVVARYAQTTVLASPDVMSNDSLLDILAWANSTGEQDITSENARQELFDAVSAALDTYVHRAEERIVGYVRHAQQAFEEEEEKEGHREGSSSNIQWILPAVDFLRLLEEEQEACSRGGSAVAAAVAGAITTGASSVAARVRECAHATSGDIRVARVLERLEEL